MPYEAPPTRLALGISLTLLASFLFAIASAFVWLFRGKFDTIQIVFFQNLRFISKQQQQQHKS